MINASKYKRGTGMPEAQVLERPKGKRSNRHEPNTQSQQNGPHTRNALLVQGLGMVTVRDTSANESDKVSIAYTDDNLYFENGKINLDDALKLDGIKNK
jgi:hypothetical protein